MQDNIDSFLGILQGYQATRSHSCGMLLRFSGGIPHLYCASMCSNKQETKQKRPRFHVVQLNPLAFVWGYIARMLMVAIATSISQFAASLREADARPAAHYWMTTAAFVGRASRLWFRGHRGLPFTKGGAPFALQLSNIVGSLCLLFLYLLRSMSRATKLWPALGTRFKEIPNWFLINEGVEVSEGCHDEVAENNHCALEPKVCQNYIH